MSVREFAEEVERPYRTVLYWVRQGLIPGVETIQESRGPVHRIPRSVVAKFKGHEPRRGRPPKQDPPAKP